MCQGAILLRICDLGETHLINLGLCLVVEISIEPATRLKRQAEQRVLFKFSLSSILKRKNHLKHR